MGKPHPKNKDEEVIITQNAVVDNDAKGDHLEHIKTNNILYITILTITIFVMMIFLYSCFL